MLQAGSLARGRALAGRFVDYKGGADSKTGEIVARVLRIERAEGTRVEGYRINCAAGPGKRNAQGAVQPAGKLDSLTTLLPDREALKMALAMGDHLQAWATATYYARRETCWKPEES